MNRPTYIVKTPRRLFTLKDWAEVTHVSAVYFEEHPDGEPLEIRQVRNEAESGVYTGPGAATDSCGFCLDAAEGCPHCVDSEPVGE